MALLSELVATCEAQRLDTAGTLNVFARRLREAGRISKAGRGRGAAHMTYLDAARFLIACAATDHPERAADAEMVFSNMVRTDAHGVDADFPLDEADAPTLDIALAKTLEWLGTGHIDAVSDARWKARWGAASPVPSMPPVIWLRIRREGSGAELRVLDGVYYYHHQALADLMSSVDSHNQEAQKIAMAAHERETHRFRTAKNLLAELELPLLRAVAELISGKKAEE